MANKKTTTVTELIDKITGEGPFKPTAAQLPPIVAECVIMIKALQKQVTDLQKQVEQTKKQAKESNDKNHERTYQLEKRVVAANIVIKNLPMAERENKEDAKALVVDVMKEMGIEDEILITDVYRFKPMKRKEGERGPDRPPILLVKLEDPGMKGAIFRNVHHLHGSRYEKISILNEFPPSVRRMVAGAEKKAYEIRKDSNFKTKTRVEIIHGKPLIKIKKEGEENFVFYEDK